MSGSTTIPSGRRLRAALVDEVPGGSNDCGFVDAKVPVEVVDIADLAEVGDAQAGDRCGIDGGQEGQGVGMTVEHGDDRRGPTRREECVEDIARPRVKTVTGLDGTKHQVG